MPEVSRYSSEFNRFQAGIVLAALQQGIGLGRRAASFDALDGLQHWESRDGLRETDRCCSSGMLDAARRKLALSPMDLLLRGVMSGALLGVCHKLCLQRSHPPDRPAIGRRADLPGWPGDPNRRPRPRARHRQLRAVAAVVVRRTHRHTSPGAIIANWGWVFLGNLIGSVTYGALLAIALTNSARRRRRASPPRSSPSRRSRRRATRRSASPASSPSSSRRCCATGWSASPSSRR